MFSIIPTLIELRKRAFDQMLDSVNDDHKKLLAEIIGRLAVAKVPDLEAVAPELDDSLTPAEKRSIQQAGSALDRNVAQAFDDVVRRIIDSGEKRLTFRPGGPLRLSHDKPGMTMLILSIEELLTRLNRFKQSRHS